MKKKILAMASVAMMSVCASAQQMPEVPLDPEVVTGTLPNGLTYFIRHNEYPKGQADFYIAQKVGSVLEEENQRGLAHFLEHMCFNGTTNFPGNNLISWLESIGVKFGAQLNAYTGTDETVYNICNVPTARPEVTDSVLLILHDWANELLLDPSEIDKERGVIHEEWRSRNVGSQRILEQLLPVMYPGSRYAYRMPIGTMEVVDNFPPQALRDYYEKWYRPDLQGIIVVGDVDPVRTEAKIKEMFGDIEMPANAAERTEFPVPDTPGTIYAIGSDKEQQQALFYLMFKFEPMPRDIRGTMGYLIYDFMTDMIDAMLQARFSEMMSNPATPFAVAQCMIGNYLVANTADMLACVGIAKEGDIRPALEAVYREVLRAKRGGFTSTEFDRARAEYMSRLEKQYNDRANLENGVYTSQLVRHFIDGTPATSMDILYPAMQQITQMVNVQMVNQLMDQMVTDDNRVVMVMMPDAEGYTLPTDAQLADVMKAVDAEEIEVFVDNVKDEPLIPALPAPGKVVSEKEMPLWGATEWTLSNGVKVIVKPTKFKEDEITFSAVARQGLGRDFGTMSVADYKVLGDVFAQTYGIGTYTSNDLEKYLTGKHVSFTPSLNTYSRSFTGSATPKDLETLGELIYGYFTSVNYPAEEFAATQNLYASLLANQEASPEYIFQRDLTSAIFTSPYAQTMTSEDILAATRESIEALTKAQVNNAADFTFIFVGNVDPEVLRAFCAQYIATLPADAATATTAIGTTLPGMEITPGTGTTRFITKMETPQTYIAVLESGNMPYTSAEAKIASIAGQIMTSRLLKTVREEMGATYSCGAGGSVNYIPGTNAQMVTSFPMKPELLDEVLKVIKDEFEAMATEVTTEELGKVKEYMVKDYVEAAERNERWRGAIGQYILSGVDVFTDAVATTEAITPADVQNFVKELNAQGNYRVVILEAE